MSQEKGKSSLFFSRWAELITLIIAATGIWFTLYDTVRVNRITAKSDLVDRYVKWLEAQQRLSCYYQYAKDKSVFPEEITEGYSDIGASLVEYQDKLKEELNTVDRFGLNSLNRQLNHGLVWTYSYHGGYHDDFFVIKKNLTDTELEQARRNCEHSV